MENCQVCLCLCTFLFRSTDHTHTKNPSPPAPFIDTRVIWKDKCHVWTCHVFGHVDFCWVNCSIPINPKWLPALWNLTGANAQITSPMACALVNLYRLSAQYNPSSLAPTLLSARTNTSSRSEPLNCDAGATRKPALHLIKLRLINTKLLQHPGFPPFHPRLVFPGSHWWKQAYRSSCDTVWFIWQQTNTTAVGVKSNICH